MKGFFDKLFGKQAPPADIQKRAEPASVTAWQQPLFEPYKIGDLIAEKYEVHRVLGKGGFGIVYLVRLRETGEAFALKTFKDELTADPAALVAFKREALVWVNLERHPSVLPAIWVEEIRRGRIATPADGGGLNLSAQQDQSACGRLLVVMDYVAADANGRASLGDHCGKWANRRDPSAEVGNPVLFGNGTRQSAWRGVPSGHQTGEHFDHPRWNTHGTRNDTFDSVQNTRRRVKGAALLALNRATEAVACFDRAISLDPNDSSAWNNKGIALMSLGQREEGAACLLRALRMRGNDPN